MKKTLVSIVIPVFNEAENVGLLHGEIAAAVKDRAEEYEIIFVDDGSSDGSLAELKRIRAADPRVKIIQFRKNFGQSAAISAGFEYCRGEVVVAMDADLQNDPADIPLLVDKVAEGYDIVNGWRRDRHDKWLTRRVPSYFGNKLISWITGVKLHDYGCTLRGFRSDVVKNLKLYGEMHRYIPAIASRMGIRSAEVVVNHRERRHGKSKYGLGRTFRVILDLISIKFLLAYSHRPLQIFGGAGLLLFLAGLVSGLVPDLYQVRPQPGHRRPAAAVLHPADVLPGLPGHLARAAGRDALAHLPRGAGQERILHPRDHRICR